MSSPTTGDRRPAATCLNNHETEGTLAPDGSLRCWCGDVLPPPAATTVPADATNWWKDAGFVPDANTPRSADARELAARRDADARLAAKYTGWKPLVFWYISWAVLCVVGAISMLSTKMVASGLVALVLAGLALLYARYLYNGGLRRVWFFIF